MMYLLYTQCKKCEPNKNPHKKLQLNSYFLQHHYCPATSCFICIFDTSSVGFCTANRCVMPVGKSITFNIPFPPSLKSRTADATETSKVFLATKFLYVHCSKYTANIYSVIHPIQDFCETLSLITSKTAPGRLILLLYGSYSVTKYFWYLHHKFSPHGQ